MISSLRFIRSAKRNLYKAHWLDGTCLFYSKKERKGNMNFSSKFLQDKNWKIFRKSIIVNGISFKVKDLAKLPLNQD